MCHQCVYHLAGEFLSRMVNKQLPAVSQHIRPMLKQHEKSLGGNQTALRQRPQYIYLSRCHVKLYWVLAADMMTSKIALTVGESLLLLSVLYQNCFEMVLSRIGATTSNNFCNSAFTLQSDWRLTSLYLKFLSQLLLMLLKRHRLLQQYKTVASV